MLTYAVVCCEAGLVGTATLLMVIALGVLLIMLRLSRQYAPHLDRSLPVHDRRMFAAAADNDEYDMNNALQYTGTCSVVNLTVNPVDLLLHHQVIIRQPDVSRNALSFTAVLSFFLSFFADVTRHSADVQSTAIKFVSEVRS